MSWLRRGRAQEGAYFRQETEFAAARLRRELKEKGLLVESTPRRKVAWEDGASEILPEILQNELPLSGGASGEAPEVRRTKVISPSSASNPVFNTSNSALDHFSRSLPQTTLGRGRWNLEALKPQDQGKAISAYERRAMRSTPAQRKQAELLAKGYFQIVKGFVLGSAIVFGGGVLAAALVVKAMGAKQLSDIPERGRDYMQPRIDAFKERFTPFKAWIREKSSGWKLEERRKQALGSPFAKGLGVPQSDTGTPRLGSSPESAEGRG
ncbi:hypothetical protein KFL_007620020 [Klebsormidium nitens]|uniref:Transmembrane protein n=1 Tax=Klebsormidium nitens TaxID=105231 RepID=A0A1Y1IRC9_KLENI|nr:hypothetical protein KFL_007620020 [Klebsormidium nitens]|eukprot:GAQ91306.1 hypothetical protein KFL_007620020 [Klebsormidium nitens]